MFHNQISCKQFTDYLIRRVEHFEVDIIRDVTPVDGWIGHVSTAMWPAYNGLERQFDKIHRIFPDLSGAWEPVVGGNCIGTPCDFPEKKIGFGYTQESFRLERKSYATDLFCFDLMMSADRAKEQMSALLQNLRMASNIIVSDRLRREAFRLAGRKVLLAANLPDLTVAMSADEMEWTPNALPTSKITIKALQRYVQPLILEGAQGSIPDLPAMFEYVTDQETAWNLREGNSDLTNMYRFTDFVKGGALYKYGVTDSIGNFGIRIDPYPMRFTETGGVLHRVMPYTNIQAIGTYGGAGLRGVVNQAYIDAPFQLDYIWNRMAMTMFTRESKPVNPMMPFAARDYSGKWQFVMDNLGVDANGCVIENKRRNKGQFIADFEFATKDVKPEWVVSFLHYRERSCFVVEEPCSPGAEHTEQDYNSANDVCECTLEITVGAITNHEVLANTISVNGVIMAHEGSGALANIGALVEWLNANMGALGTWAVLEGSTTVITLTSEACSEVTVPVVAVG